MNFKDAAEKNEPWIIEQRRFFHQCPELSEQEKNTTLEIGKRLEEIRRSGLVLEDMELLEAWEQGEDKQYIPVKFRSGKPSAESLASLERMGILRQHIARTLRGMARQLRQGSIAADPYYRSQQENACLNCDYYDACHFSDGENGENCRYMPKLSGEKVWAMLDGGEEDE